MDAWDTLNRGIVNLSESSALVRVLDQALESLEAGQPIRYETICELSALTSALDRGLALAHASVDDALSKLHLDAGKAVEASAAASPPLATSQQQRVTAPCKRRRRANPRTVRRG